MNSLRKQALKTLSTVCKLQRQTGRYNYSQVLKQNTQYRFNNSLSSQMRYRFAEEKEAKEEQQEQNEVKQEEKQEETKVEDLPDDFNKLLSIGSKDAISKAKQMYQKLDDTIFQQKKDHKNLSNKFEGVEKSNADLLKKVSALRDHIKGMEEETELVRKRLMKEKDDEKVFGISKFAKELLETTDNLERAIDNSKENKDFDTLFEGTEMTYKILMNSLKKFQVIQVNPFKEKFDPNHMDALMQVDDPNQEPGSVAFVIQSGFKIGERCLRPAKVGIVREQPQQQQAQQEEEKQQ